MKFIYEYRTSDNVRHSGVVKAATRDAAFATLKKQGIRPGCVHEAPGFFNKLFGKGKRWFAIGVLAVVSVVAISFARNAKDELEKRDSGPTPRHQIYGEPTLMNRIVDNGYATVFTEEGDRFLAKYAQPGIFVKPLDSDAQRDMADALKVAAGKTVPIAKDEPREIRELKRIVNGMHDELRHYLANGKGTPLTYIKRLNERQVRELQIYHSAKHDMSKMNDAEKCDRLNASLRAIGLPTVLPDEIEPQNGLKNNRKIGH